MRRHQMPDHQFRIVLLSVLAVVPGTAVGEETRPVLSLTPDALEAGVELTEAGWKYRPGDDPSGRRRELDDTTWETLRTTDIGREAIPTSGWNGVGWFRLHLQVDPRLVGQPIGLILNHSGASEVFLDGRLVNRFGTVSATRDGEQPYYPNGMPVVMSFRDPGAHLLAVRLSNSAMRDLTAGWGRWLLRWGKAAGFSAHLGYASHMIRQHDLALSAFHTVAAVCAALIIALGALHGLIFLFYRKVPESLAFCISACALGVLLALETIGQIGHYGVWFDAFRTAVSNSLIMLFVVGFLAFLQMTFFSRLPRYLWVYGGILAIACLLQVIDPRLTLPQWASGAVMAFFVVDSLRLIGRAWWQRLDGAAIIGVAALLNLAFPAILVLRFWGVQIPAPIRSRIVFVSLLGLVVAVSIHLARRAARVSHELEERIDEVQELSQRTLDHERREAEMRVQQEHDRAEHARRLRELEEARKLQLSLLPASMPELPHLDIAAYMRTATEVGGDYYDVHVAADGTLTLAVGDATGHGLRAGTLVTATKGLFRAYANDSDLTRMLRESSRVLQEMNLGSLFMALQVVRIADGRLVCACAGMPPALVYRTAAGTVEPVATPAPPLGVAIKTQYRVQEHVLTPGDVVLLMSDGLPERFNPAGEILGYDQIPTLLRNVASEDAPAATIVQRLIEAGETWAGGRAQDDDMTLVAIRARNGLGQAP